MRDELQDAVTGGVVQASTIQWTRSWKQCDNRQCKPNVAMVADCKGSAYVDLILPCFLLDYCDPELRSVELLSSTVLFRYSSFFIVISCLQPLRAWSRSIKIIMCW